MRDGRDIVSEIHIYGIDVKKKEIYLVFTLFFPQLMENMMKPKGRKSS